MAVIHGFARVLSFPVSSSYIRLGNAVQPEFIRILKNSVRARYKESISGQCQSYWEPKHGHSPYCLTRRLAA